MRQWLIRAGLLGSAIALLAPPALAVAAPVAPAAPPAAAPKAPADRPRNPPFQYSFVAAPDFLNRDVADVSGLAGWDPGDPNSWTPQLQASIDRFLDEVAARAPGSVLVPGDMVNGEWLTDATGTGIFGPSTTDRERTAMVRAAGDFYHAAWRQRFTDRGLTVHTALGDHELGDNPWRDPFHLRTVDVMRSVYARHHTRNPDGTARYAQRPVSTRFARSAYAVALHPEVLLVTLDEFDNSDTGMRLRVTGDQLVWLRAVLRKARTDGVQWVIVQGHLPILGPVRHRNSSNLMLRGGRQSALWKTLRHYGVDLYLAGEVHDTTMVQADGITQITTGGALTTTSASFLAVQVSRARMVMELREFPGHIEGTPEPLWSLGTPTTTAGALVLDPSRRAGRAVLSSAGLLTAATGKLVPFGPGLG